MSIEQLFSITLEGDYDDEAAWLAIHELRKLGTREVFDIAAAWCKSDDPLRRARGKLSERVAEAASSMLGMENTPPDWDAGQYRLALRAVLLVMPIDNLPTCVVG